MVYFLIYCIEKSVISNICSLSKVQLGIITINFFTIKSNKNAEKNITLQLSMAMVFVCEPFHFI